MSVWNYLSRPAYSAELQYHFYVASEKSFTKLQNKYVKQLWATFHCIVRHTTNARQAVYFFQITNIDIPIGAESSEKCTIALQTRIVADICHTVLSSIGITIEAGKNLQKNLERARK